MIATYPAAPLDRGPAADQVLDDLRESQGEAPVCRALATWRATWRVQWGGSGPRPFLLAFPREIHWYGNGPLRYGEWDRFGSTIGRDVVPGFFF